LLLEEELNEKNLEDQGDKQTTTVQALKLRSG